MNPLLAKMHELAASARAAHPTSVEAQCVAMSAMARKAFKTETEMNWAIDLWLEDLNKMVFAAEREGRLA